MSSVIRTDDNKVILNWWKINEKEARTDPTLKKVLSGFSIKAKCSTFRVEHCKVLHSDRSWGRFNNTTFSSELKNQTNKLECYIS
jgi:hypothetical protein